MIWVNHKLIAVWANHNYNKDMRGLVMDGVRRPGRGEGPLMLGTMAKSAAAPAMTLPQPLAITASNSLDGLRRVTERLLPSQIAESPASISQQEATPTGWQMRPYAIASLAVLPMVAAAGTWAVRSTLMSKPVAASPAVTVNPAPTPAPDPAAEAAAAAALAQTQSLQALLDDFGRSTTYSVYVKDLKTGHLAVVGPDRSFRSASLYKLFVASEIYHRIDTGQLSYTSGAGNGRTIASCLNLMITISDNGCGDAMGSLIGWNNLTQILKAQGYSGTNLNQPMTTTPRDVAKLYERLYAGTLGSVDSNGQFMKLLTAQKVNNRLPQGLPVGTTFAHKTGDLYGFMHDAGIVYGPKTDYLVVMMGAPGSVPSNFSALSSKLYSFFNN